MSTVRARGISGLLAMFAAARTGKGMILLEGHHPTTNPLRLEIARKKTGAILRNLELPSPSPAWKPCSAQVSQRPPTGGSQGGMPADRRIFTVGEFPAGHGGGGVAVSGAVTAMTDALATLPHGPEFRFVDRLLSWVPGESGEAEYLLRGDEAFLAGHFPGAPLMPGVLLIEAVAQLGGVVAQSHPELPPLPNLRLAAVQNAKITGSALPGEAVTLCARVVGRMGPLIQIEGRAEVGGVVVLTTRLTLSGTP